MLPENRYVVRRRLVWKRRGRGGSKILRANVGGTIWKREMGHLLLRGDRKGN